MRLNNWHDVASPLEGVFRYPKILLDQTENDVSKFLRKKVMKEQNIKRFGKLGVSRTIHHKIEGLPDCEYSSLSSVVDSLETARKDGISSLTHFFFESAGDRLFRDADLLTIPDIVLVLNEHVLVNHLNLKLMNKLKNEIIYDSQKIFDFMEIGIILNSFSHFNITSPRLLVALMKRGDELLATNTTSVPPNAICLVIRSLCRTSKMGLQIRKFISHCLSKLMVDNHSLSDVALTLRVLIDNQFMDIPEEVVRGLLDRVPSDIDTASNMIYVAKFCGKEIPGGIVQVVEKNCSALESAVTCPQIGSKSMRYIEGRNRAAEIFARILIGLEDGASDELKNLVTSESVRGMKMHQLKKLADRFDTVKTEISRRKNRS